MKKKYIFNLLIVLVASLFSIYGCENKREVVLTSSQTSDQNVSERNTSSLYAPKSAIPGKIIFKVGRETSRDIKLINSGVIQMSSVPGPMSAALSAMNTHKVERLVLPSGKFEGALKDAGLDRWYIASFDEETPLPSAFSLLNSVAEIEKVEYSCKAEVFGSAQGEEHVYDLIRSDKYPFDDEYLPLQWHYNNLGDKYWSKQGCDINLFKAWEITTGTPNVIVCVVDGGIDVTHPDLVDNLWVNPGEAKNDHDDDDNGYKDDIHGFCFVSNSADILPDADGHGTHVAGTVAARSNNGIGVAGVAGGNDKDPKATGVRLMSAAILRANPDGVTTKGASTENIANAIIYGALNGATISQNSWGYPFASGVEVMPDVIKEAIDFFIDKAGTVLVKDDPNYGEQRKDSPMKGGIVFFAAGNDNLDYPTPPANYERVIAVSAVAPNFTKASYSTYGDWVDIAAPGGDMQRYGEKAGVLSTMAPAMLNGEEYHYYHGTSMACPHISGVAALVLSKFGGQGFTNDELKARMLASVLPVDLDKVNPQYAGKLGIGTIDAYATLTLKNDHKAPDKPEIIKNKSTENAFTALTVYWVVPNDEDDNQPLRYRLYVSNKPLDKNNYLTDGDVSGTANGFISGVGTKPGDEMSFTVSSLEPATTYHFALVAYDKWGNTSEPSFFAGDTKVNHAPEISNIPSEPIFVIDRSTYLLDVKDIDGHSWSYEIAGDRGGITHRKVTNGIELVIRPVLGEGEHAVKVVLTDELGLTKTFSVPFRVVYIKKPILKSPIQPLLVGIHSEPIELALPSYFEKPYFLSHSFKAISSNPAVASTFINEAGHLFIIGEKPGKTSIVVTASNGYMTTNTTIEVTVTEDATSDVFAVWPIPVQRELNIWLNPKYNAAHVKVQSVNGELIFQEDAKVNDSGAAQIDMKHLMPGSYVLVIKVDGRETVRSILKK